MHRTRPLLTVSVAALAVAGLAACGSTAAKPAAASGAPSTSSGSGAGQPAMTAVQALSTTSKTLDGYRSVTMKLTATVGGTGASTLSGRVGWGGPLAEDITVSAPAQEAAKLGVSSMAMKVSDSVMYMNMGPKMAAALQGKQWMKIDLKATAGSSDATFKNIFDQSAGTSPATQLNLLLKAPGMKRIGAGTVNGVQAVHYGGTVDLKALVATTLAGDPALKAFVDASTASGMGAMQIDVWVDGRNLPVEIHESGQTETGPMDTTVDYSDFSTSPLVVTPPPASDTLDMASMLAGLGH